MQYTCKIVGAHFRPPAKSILQFLPSDCPLTLVPESENEFDPNAIAVYVASTDIPEFAHKDLDEHAKPFGYDIDTILEAASWQLGYIPRTDAAEISLLGSTIGTLSFDAKGPLVVFDTMDAVGPYGTEEDDAENGE